MSGVVIIGAGQGGLQMAASLRQEGYMGGIVLLGDEAGLPYQRPPLSKAFMANGDAAALTLKPDSFFEKNNIAYHPKTRATSIDRQSKIVFCEDGRHFAYETLVLATGTRNHIPPFAQIEAKGLYALRGLEDAKRLRQGLANTRRAVVIGGGFIGLEFAAMAKDMRVDVTVLEGAPRLMARAVSPAMSEAFYKKHCVLGTDIQLGVFAKQITQTPDGAVSGVELTDGRHIPGDLVLLAVGVKPNVDLAEDAGLELQNGVKTDAYLRSSDPDIFALGDVATFPFGQDFVRLESVQAAVDHARHIAKTLTNKAPPPYGAVPWFWSDQADWKLQMAGFSTAVEEDVICHRDAGAPMVLRFVQQHLVSVETVNEPSQHMAARQLMGASRAILAANDFDLKRTLQSLKEAKSAAIATG